ncbi:MAG: SGNH/GDSL hydrolase family protein [Candidatus Thiodiazotropha sp.]
MKNVLIYADSLSWGIIPDTRKRLSFGERWPGVMECVLNARDMKVRVIENCLNGRRTVWSDPFKQGRDASRDLSQVVEMNAPLDLVILMLGTNDFQATHANSAWMSAQGTSTLIDIIKSAPIEPGMPAADILIVCPPTITQPRGAMADKFKNAEKRYVGLPQALSNVCTHQGVHYFDSNEVIQSSQVDGIHLDKREHQVLGEAMATRVERLIAN